MGDDQSLAGTWAKLSEVAVKGAQYNSRERQPHPKCLQGTRVDLLKYVHGLLDNTDNNQLIWLHGTAGVGKSAVAFTVAENLKGQKVTEKTNVEKRLAGTFFFSRKHTERCTAGYFFTTLVYQLGTNFPSIQQDVNRAIRKNPALLHPDTPLCDQMEALFLQPLRNLRSRLHECLPLTFVIDALDECTSEHEITDLILSLAQALREPDLPVTHILLTSRSESHICKAFQKEEVRPLVREIPVKTSGEGVATIISLDGADVDEDIYIFLQHSFKELQYRHPDFPQPSGGDLAKLASRAGRRFIVASTMMNFIVDDGYEDPRERLQLMLELTSELLPGTELYKLYDCILSTCSDPKRAYLHLSIVVALADPLPLSQISILLGPGQGCDTEKTLLQLRSVMDIPTDNTLPVNLYHSSIRDYVSNPSHCGLPQVRDIASPHSLLAYSSLRLIKTIPKRTALLDTLSELKKQSRAMQPKDPHKLKDSLAFLVQPLEPLSAVICMLWLRGDRTSDLQSWLGTMDGHAWLETEGGQDWLETKGGLGWLETKGGRDWLQTNRGRDWVQIQAGREWLQIQGGREWLQTDGGREWLQTEAGREWLQTEAGRDWLQTQAGRDWLQTRAGRDWLQTRAGQDDWLQTRAGQNWLQTWAGRDWLQSRAGQDWLLAQAGRDWLQTWAGQNYWLQTQAGQDWLQTQAVQDWLQTQAGRDWLQTQAGWDWLQTQAGRDWLQVRAGQDWLQTWAGRDWLQTWAGQDWLQTLAGQGWLQTQEGQGWLQARAGRGWLQTQAGRDWLQTQAGRDWLQTQAGRDWLQTEGRRDYWLQTRAGRDYWLQTQAGREWLETQAGRDWLETQAGRNWLETQATQDWLQTRAGRDWLQTRAGRDWLQTQVGRDWLQTWVGRYWLQTDGGQDYWLQTQAGRDYWLQTQAGRDYWSQTQAGRDWLQTQAGRDWLQTQAGRDWLQTQTGQGWVQTQEGQDWLQTEGGPDWLQTEGGPDWLQTERGRDWLQTQAGRDWLEIWGGAEWLEIRGGREWLRTEGGQDWVRTEGGLRWLQTQAGRHWLQTLAGRHWLQSQAGRDWLQTPNGQEWLSTPAASVWVTIDEFLRTSEAINDYIITSDAPLLPVFQVIQQFKTLPDFLKFPVFLALRHSHHSTSAMPESLLCTDRQIIHAINAFESFANEAVEHSQSASDALKYACHNWAVHFSRAPNPRDDVLNRTFQAFWNADITSWLEMEWCLKGLRSCLVVLSEGQKFVKPMT